MKRRVLNYYFNFLYITMLNEETLERFNVAVVHMREVHRRAVLLNMAVLANWEQLRWEARWVNMDNHQKGVT